MDRIDRRVVVTGMGAVTPVGNDVNSFWNNISAGVNGIAEIQKFDTADFKAKIAAEVKDYQPELYLERNEIRKMDVYTQFAIGAACQAVAESGIEAMRGSDRFGVYFGSGIGGLQTMSTELVKLHENGPRKVSPHYIPMMIPNTAAGMIAIRFGAHGPCVATVTACATGTNSIGEAYRAIKHGYADVILAGGSEYAAVPIGVAGFTNSMALCTSNDPDNASMPFDKRRSGFVIGEGAGALVLEELEHAKARGAEIYAELAGYGSTCDAHHITAPGPEGVSAAKSIADSIADALDIPGENIYYNAHGTSTPLNDKTETMAIKKAFGDKAYSLKISSTKSMTGHMLGAAGAVEAIASILAMKYGVVPPTINYREPDPDCDLNYTPNKAEPARIRLAVSASFGFGGHNACIAFKPLEGQA